MVKVTSTIVQKGVSSTITQLGVASIIVQKGVISTIVESGYVSTPPAFSSAEIGNVADNKLVITFSQNINTSYIPAITAFIVSGISGNPTVINVAILGTDITLTLSSDASEGETILVSYTIPGSNYLRGTDGDVVESFSGESVTNNVLPAYSAEYALVYNSMTNKPSAADALIQATMLDALVAGGYYAKAEFLDVFSAHSNTAGESQKNWRNPGTFDPTLVNSPGWVAYAGFTGDTAGVKYTRTNFIPSANGTLIGQNNICAIIGIGNNIDNSTYDNGVTDGTNGLVLRSRSSAFASRCMVNGATSTTHTGMLGGIGHFSLRRQNATQQICGKNSTFITVSANSTGLPTKEIYTGGASNLNGVATVFGKQIRYHFLSSYLTDVELNAVIGIMETYLDNYTTGLY